MATNERDLIDQAYEGLVKSAFAVFHTGRTIIPPGKDPNIAVADAERAFQQQLAALKASRDRAIQLVAGDD